MREQDYEGQQRADQIYTGMLAVVGVCSHSFSRLQRSLPS